MSTRKLILAALVCGLAILLAGGVLLFRLSSTADPSEQRIVAVGTTQIIGTSSAVVESSQQDGSTMTLVVAVTAGEGGVDDLRAAWSLLGPRGLVPRSVPAGDGVGECAAAPLPFRETSRCAVAFDLGDDEPSALTAFFRSSGEAAGWSIPGP